MRGPILLALLGATVLAACAGENEERAAPPAQSSWQRIEPGGATRCARGGKYAFWLRRADPKRLLVFFQGGGGCFSEETCQPGSTWFDDRIEAFDDPAGSGGILDFANRDNPFRDHSAVYIPSCTGDVHSGSRLVRYGPLRVHQKGFLNAQAALARAYREFPDPEKVFVTGCSAGSVGSAFHADSIIRRYPRRARDTARRFARLRLPPADQPRRLGHARALPRLVPAKAATSAVDDGGVRSLVRSLARAHPDRTFARFNHAEDRIQVAFYQAVGGSADDFSARLRIAERERKRLPNYRSYLACGSEHCAFQGGEFYALRVGGVRLRDWVADLAAGRDMDCPDCGAG